MATLVAVRSPEHCDSASCSAQAYWRFDSKTGTHLCFCGHHSDQHMRALQDAGFTPSILVVQMPPPTDE